jgi:hypothetical protein
MPDRSEPTVRLVLGLVPEEGKKSLFDESGEAIRALRAQLGEGLPPGVWTAVHDRLESTVAAACDIPLTTVLAEAWKIYKPLREYCDPVRHPPGETTTTELASHTVSSVQHPTVDFLVGEKSVFTLALDASVILELEGAVLTLGDGRFLELATGKSRVAASLSYRGAQLVKREFGAYKLPGKISFGEGIPICPDLSYADRPSPQTALRPTDNV